MNTWNPINPKPNSNLKPKWNPHIMTRIKAQYSIDQNTWSCAVLELKWEEAETRKLASFWRKEKKGQNAKPFCRFGQRACCLHCGSIWEEAMERRAGEKKEKQREKKTKETCVAWRGKGIRREKPAGKWDGEADKISWGRNNLIGRDGSRRRSVGLEKRVESHRSEWEKRYKSWFLLQKKGALSGGSKKRELFRGFRGLGF